MSEDTECAGIVVVHHGGCDELARSLAALVDDPSPVARRIVVVDNSAGSAERVVPAHLPEGAALVACPDNPGFGEGANRGVRTLRRGGPFSFYAVFNHDVEVAPGFLQAASRALGPGVGAVGGPLFLERFGGELWYAGGTFRRLTGTVAQDRSPATGLRPRDVGFIPGAALVLSCGAWEEVGGFDPAFFLYHEDLDLCLRLRRAGWRLRFEPGMAAVHHLGAATGSARGSALYLLEMARTRFLPHPSRLYRLYLAVLHSGYVALRALRFLALGGRLGREKATALIRGHRMGLKTVWCRSTGDRTP